MKETKFIEENKEKWEAFEKSFKQAENDPETLSKLYNSINEDLGYAQTFYNKRTVRVYLNQLTQQVFSGVHKHRKEGKKSILNYFLKTLPVEVYKARKTIFFAFAAFLVYCLIGIVTTYVNPEFPRVVMGDSYVDMTLENIARGNPLAVYQGQETGSMFVTITTNNLKVAFLTFFAGYLFTIGTHLLLFSNGVMLGAFQYFFKTKGLLITSFLGIWIHGAFEISAIVLAGGAGITAGNGWLFPKSYSRYQSMRISTIRGMRIMISLVPFIIMAGFLESFVTRNYQILPEWSKWLVISFSFFLILFYYIVFPFFVAKRNPELVEKEEELVEENSQSVTFYKVKSQLEIVKDTIVLYFQIGKKIFPWIYGTLFPIGLLLALFQGWSHYSDMLNQHWYDWYQQVSIITGFGKTNIGDFLAGLVWSFMLIVLFIIVFYQLKKKEKHEMDVSFNSYFKTKFWGIYACFAPIYWLSFFSVVGMGVLLLFILPLFVHAVSYYALSDEPISIKKSFSFSRKQYFSGLAVLIIFALAVSLLAQPIALVYSMHESWSNKPEIPDLLDKATDFINNIGIRFTEDYMYYSNSFRQLIYLLFVFAVLPLYGIYVSISTYSLKEKQEAISLKQQFSVFGRKRKMQHSNVSQAKDAPAVKDN